MSDRNELGQFIKIHGMIHTREYGSWSAMKKRCLVPENKSYPNYGGRGITVCQEWIDSFEQFYKDMGDRPANTTLHRIDNDGNYCPENCKWATPAEQARDRRSNVWIEYNGKEQCISDWANEYDIDPTLLRQRYIELGWDFYDALTRDVYEGNMITFQGKTQNIKDWAIELNIPYKALHLRIKRYMKKFPHKWPDIETCLTRPFMETNRQDWDQVITINGKTQPMRDFIKELGIDVQDVSQRLRQGWELEDAITTPKQKYDVLYTYNGKTLSLTEWSKELGISVKTLYTRKYKGLSIEQILAK